jgi:hypothetical protein
MKSESMSTVPTQARISRRYALKFSKKMKTKLSEYVFIWKGYWQNVCHFGNKEESLHFLAMNRIPAS